MQRLNTPIGNSLPFRWQWLGFAMIGAVVVSCATPPAPSSVPESSVSDSTEVDPDSTPTVASVPSPPAPNSAMTPDNPDVQAPADERLAVAGFEDPQALKDFLMDIQAAAIAQDRPAIAALVHYPFTTYDSGEPLKTYDTAEELLNDFDQVITPAVIKAMAEASYDDLFVNYQGVMLGNGQVWLQPFDEGIKIRAINS
jgi:hypothetical protein